MITDMKQYGLKDRILVLASMYPELTVGRIVSQKKGLYRIATSNGEKLAEVSGKFRYGAVTVCEMMIRSDIPRPIVN